MTLRKQGTYRRYDSDTMFGTSNAISTLVVTILVPPAKAIRPLRTSLLTLITTSCDYRGVKFVSNKVRAEGAETLSANLF